MPCINVQEPDSLEGRGRISPANIGDGNGGGDGGDGGIVGGIDTTEAAFGALGVGVIAWALSRGNDGNRR